MRVPISSLFSWEAGACRGQSCSNGAKRGSSRAPIAGDEYEYEAFGLLPQMELALPGPVQVSWLPPLLCGHFRRGIPMTTKPTRGPDSDRGG